MSSSGDLFGPYREQLLDFIERRAGPVALTLGPDLRIRAANVSFRAALDLSGDPVGRPLQEFMAPGGDDLLASLPKDATCAVRLNLECASGSVQSLDCAAYPVAEGWLLLGERSVLTDGAILKKMTALGNELMNASRELHQKNRDLQVALDEVRTLRGILPTCAYCKKIRDDKGVWKQMESYISEKSGAQFSHGYCPDCVKQHFPEYCD